MSQNQIDAKNVTKPIQLLAAWLIGLILVNAAFLGVAASIQGWERSALVLASIVNVPVFLFALFLLQTKFRPELQEDIFYSKYLDSKTNQIVTKSKFESIEKELSSLKMTMVENLSIRARADDSIRDPLGINYKIGLNRHLKNFSKIREFLKSKDIPVADIFGAKRPPDGAYLVLDNSIDFRTKINFLKIAMDFELDSYGYFDSEEEGIYEDILIGGYAKKEVPFSEELRKLLSSNIDPADLREFERPFIRPVDL